MRARRFIAALATSFTLAGTGIGLGALVPGTALSAGNATAATSAEMTLLALTNQVRAGVGAPALSLDDSLSSVARTWALAMANQGGISHNPALSSQLDGWTRLAENVGVGFSVNQVHDALVASPSHYTNLTNAAYSLVGIGVVTGGGRVYVVEDFETPSGGGRASAGTDPEPSPTVSARTPTTPTTTMPPPPEPPARPAPAVVRPTPVPPPTPAPAPAQADSTFHYVLDTLRALDSSHHHS